VSNLCSLVLKTTHIYWDVKLFKILDVWINATKFDELVSTR